VGRFAKPQLIAENLPKDTAANDAQEAAVWLAVQMGTPLSVHADFEFDQNSSLANIAKESEVELIGASDSLDDTDADFIIASANDDCLVQQVLAQLKQSAMIVRAGLDFYEEPMLLIVSDLSENSREAMDVVLTAGYLYDARVHLLHLLDSEEQRDEHEPRLHDQLSSTDFRTLTYGLIVHVEVGTAAEVIPKFVADNDIDLLVMGREFGSTDDTLQTLVTETSCSVMLIQ